MKERPILFSTPMVRAILAGTKTQTRRVVKLREFKPTDTPGYEWIFRDRRSLWNDYTTADLVASKHNPYGAPGDRLWVKETHQIIRLPNERICAYRASCPGDQFTYVDPVDGDLAMLKVERWKPSIFMRRLESRITLEVTSVRVERLHAITEEDATAEGVAEMDGLWDEAEMCRAAKIAGSSYEDARGWFAGLWFQINGEESWSANPFVWVLSFRRVAAQERAA